MSAESPLVPFCAPAPCPIAAEGAAPGGELLTVGIAVVQERFCARGAP